MKARLKTFLDRLFFTPKPLPPGNYQAVIDFNDTPFRLHLRIEEEGKGILIVNASTILHLNPTATEIAYHLMKQTPEDTITSQLVERYQVSADVANQDIQELRVRLLSLIETPDLDPETFLDMERIDIYPSELSTPVRADCALTYDSTEGHSELFAPVERVKRTLDTEEWKSILTKLWNAGIPHVVFTGGESTLRPDLIELVEHAESLGQVTGLITDGLRLTANDYLEHLLSSGLDHLMIILNPSNEQSWEAIRDASNADIFLNVHLTINQQVMSQLRSILDKLRNIGVVSISLSAESKEYKELLSEAQQKVAESGLGLTFDLPVPYSAINPISLELEESEARATGAGRTWVYVEPDGDVLPGQGINQPLGNLLADEWITVSGNRKLNDQA